MSEGKLVLAGNYNQFIRWCEENKENPRKHTFISDGDCLQGRRLVPSQIVRYGTFFERRDLIEIERMILSRLQ